VPWTNDEHTAGSAVIDKFAVARELIYGDGPVWPLLELVSRTDPVMSQYVRDHVKEKYGEAAQVLVDTELAAPWRTFEGEVLRVRGAESWCDYTDFFLGHERVASDAPRQRLRALLEWYNAITHWWDRHDHEWQWRWWACLMLRLQAVDSASIPTDEASRVRQMVEHALRSHIECSANIASGTTLIGFVTGTSTSFPAYIQDPRGPFAARCRVWETVVERARADIPDRDPLDPWSERYSESYREAWASSVYGPLCANSHDRLRQGGVSLARSAQQVGIPLRYDIKAQFGLRSWRLPWDIVV
jgi:hypothetical protein